MRALGFVACAALALGTSGCSFLFTKKPPSTEPDKIPITHSVRCTSSVVAPVVDTIVGALQVARTGFAISRDSSDYEGAQITKEMDIAFGVTLATAYVSSAIYGYVITSDCRALRARLQGFPDRRPESDPETPSSETTPASQDPTDSAANEPHPSYERALCAVDAAAKRPKGDDVVDGSAPHAHADRNAENRTGGRTCVRPSTRSCTKRALCPLISAL